MSFPDIQAWAQLTGSKPTPREVLALREMDAAFLGALSTKEGSTDEGQ